MNKKVLILLPLIAMLLTGCNKSSAKAFDFDAVDSNTLTTTTQSGQIGAFDLVSPTNNSIVDEVPVFEWTAAENATKYTLEVCSSMQFASDLEAVDYYSQKNIVTTKFQINANLTHLNSNYYWRVFAYNDSKQEVMSTSVFTFYMKAPEVEEVPFDLGNADDWSVHQVGSRADISIDNTDFFGTGDESLVISFTEEYTHQGNVMSDGWIVVTRTIEKSIYGTDSLFFNMYYAGQDSTIFIRLVDRDNEYWYAPVQLSNNAKQTVILRFEDFIQRTRDVPVANEHFDYERIKYMEVVFEKTFGDGVFLLSGVKAIKFDNYRDRYIETLDFSKFTEADWVYEAYEFEKEINETELTLNYYGTNDMGKPKINGYGFAKLVAHRYLYSGDAIKLNVKYTGNAGSNIVIRIYEEDTDRWSYKIPFNTLTVGEYSEILIPFKAFAKSSILGDGRRQFYYIINLQFGLEGQYSTGSITFKDFQIVKSEDYIDTPYRVVGNDGVIETFDNYNSSSELFLSWQVTDVNKDEYMTLNTVNKLGGTTNPYCGQFEYKADMEPAQYTLPMKVNGSFKAFSIWMKDASMKWADDKYSHLTYVSPKVNMYITLNSGEIYRYTIEVLDRIWYKYNIPFDSFELTNKEDLPHPPNDIEAEAIDSFTLAFQYFYYDVNGRPAPTYADDNPVYLDNLMFTEDAEFSKISLEKIVHQIDNIATLDDFEDYSTTDDLLYFWTHGREYEYQNMELSSDVSSQGGHYSVKLQYRTNSDSPAYYISPNIADDVKGKGIRFDMKGDGKATVYVNIYLNINGTTVQYRTTISTVADVWKEYCIGFDIGNGNFAVIAGPSGRALTYRDLIYVSRVSFGMVKYNESSAYLSEIYVDNIRFDASLSYAANTSRVID